MVECQEVSSFRGQLGTRRTQASHSRRLGGARPPSRVSLYDDLRPRQYRDFNMAQWRPCQAQLPCNRQSQDALPPRPCTSSLPLAMPARKPHPAPTEPDQRARLRGVGYSASRTDALESSALAERTRPRQPNPGRPKLDDSSDRPTEGVQRHAVRGARQISVGVDPPCATPKPTLPPAQCAQLAHPQAPVGTTAYCSGLGQRSHSQGPRPTQPYVCPRAISCPESEGHCVDWRVGSWQRGSKGRWMVRSAGPLFAPARRGGRLTDINTTLSPSQLPLFPLLIPSRKNRHHSLLKQQTKLSPVSQNHQHPSTCADPTAPAAPAARALAAAPTASKGRRWRPACMCPCTTQDVFSVGLASGLTGLARAGRGGVGGSERGMTRSCGRLDHLISGRGGYLVRRPLCLRVKDSSDRI